MSVYIHDYCGTPLKQLVPITELLWLITDTQLTKLHQAFHKGECRYFVKRFNVARRMNVSDEIVHNWCEHMRYRYMHETGPMRRQRLSENIVVFY